MVGKFIERVSDSQPSVDQWNVKRPGKHRALLISKPKFILEGAPGTILMPTIEIKNST